MLFKYLFIIIIVASFTSCTKETDKIETRNGIIYEEGSSKPFTGKVVDVVYNKKIEYEVVDGKKNGEFKIYFENGNPEMIGNIKNNMNEGYWKYFYPSGKIESEGIFENDLPAGEWKWYFENGVIKEKGYFEKGEKKGTWILFFENGKIKEERKFM